MKHIFNYDVTSGTETITTGDTFTSEALGIRHGDNFGVHVVSVSGTAPDFTITFTECDTADGTFIAPDSNTVAANAATTGMYSLTPIVARYIKLVVVNDSANSVTLGIKLAVQDNA